MTNLCGRPIYQKTGKRKSKGLAPVSAKKRAQRTTALRANAKGKQCALRLDGCRNDPQYTVLAHLRRFGMGGMSLKPHDLLAVFACDRCHEKQERRHPLCPDTEVLRALAETLMIQVQTGTIRIEGDERVD